MCNRDSELAPDAFEEWKKAIEKSQDKNATIDLTHSMI